MRLNTIKRKTKRLKSRTVGRGGKRGKTAGRGTKGQNARSGRKKRPEERDIIKKLPKLRGYFNNTIQKRVVSLPLSTLEKMPKGEVTTRTLEMKGLIKKTGNMYPRVKILGTGTLSSALVLKGIQVSASAKEAIEKAGGSVRA